MSDCTLADIKSKVRKLTGRPSVHQLSNSDLLTYINNYYQYSMPSELDLDELETWFEMTTGVGQGSYPLDAEMRYIKKPITIDGIPISFYTDADFYFTMFPRDKEDSTTWQEPYALLLYDRMIYLRPIPNDNYVLRCSTHRRPEPFVNESDTPEDLMWFSVIAYGAAIAILMDNGEDDELTAIGEMYSFYKNIVTRKNLMALGMQDASRRW